MYRTHSNRYTTNWSNNTSVIIVSSAIIFIDRMFTKLSPSSSLRKKNILYFQMSERGIIFCQLWVFEHFILPDNVGPYSLIWGYEVTHQLNKWSQYVFVAETINKDWITNWHLKHGLNQHQNHCAIFLG